MPTDLSSESGRSKVDRGDDVKTWNWGTIIGVPAAVIAVITIVVMVLQYRAKSRYVQSLLITAQQYQDVDDFGDALLKIDAALTERPGDQAIRIRRLELETFRNAADYDQTQHVKDKQVIKKLQDNCKQLRNEVGDDPRILVLCGIVEELDDHPTRAIQEFYERAVHDRPNYANAYNAWGYTIYKWEMGDKEWSTGALDKFSKAASFNSQYAWPYINIAMVYLYAEDSDKAKINLDLATPLLPKNPRLHELWGAYHLSIAKRLRMRKLPEARRSFDQAAVEFQEAKDENPNLADVRANLGGAFEELGDREDDALYEYEQATKLDEWNIQACADYARVLARRRDGKALEEYRRCDKVLSGLLSDASARMAETNDMAAREMLAKKTAEYEQLRAALHKLPIWRSR